LIVVTLISWSLLRLRSFGPNPAGIGARTPWVSRDRTRRALIPVQSSNVFGYSLSGFHPAQFPPKPSYSTGFKKISVAPVDRIPNRHGEKKEN
jgi:hypothetical protein